MAILAHEYDGHRTEFRCSREQGEDLFHKRCREGHKMHGLRRVTLYSDDWRVLEQTALFGGAQPLYIAKRFGA